MMLNAGPLFRAIRQLLLGVRGFIAPARLAFVCVLLTSESCTALPNQDQWYGLATAGVTSPAAVDASDATWQWLAPDGRQITARVKAPVVPAGSPTATLEPVPAGADARPYFERLIASAKASGAHRITIPPGQYTFRTTETAKGAHWLISGLKDVVIDGNGAVLLFANNADGIYLTQSQRVVLSNIVLDYTLHMVSLGKMVLQGGAPVLQIDPAYPVTAADGIGHITEYNRATGRPAADPIRVYNPSGKDMSFIGNHSYGSAMFTPAQIGRSFLVFHHFYGGVALKLQDDQSSGAGQEEDITLSRVTLLGGPGMGIIVYGVRRGVAIRDSQIVPGPGRLISTEYDAIHVQLLTGDLALVHNTISSPGDDGINLDSPVSPVIVANTGSPSIVLGKYSRFIQKGHTLAFFDGQFNLIAMAKATDAVTALGGLNYFVKLDKNVDAVTTASFVRDIDLTNSRVYLADNTITDGDTLVQVPNVLVINNRFTNTGLRLLASVGSFQEGVGALNVLVRNNQFQGGHTLYRYNLPYAPILAYALDAKSRISTLAVNRYLTIQGNSMNALPLSCISAASTEFLKIIDNICRNTNASAPSGYDINLVNDNHVVEQGNSVRSALGIHYVNVTDVSH